MRKYSRSDLEKLINEWVIGLHSKRNKKIIHDRLIYGMPIAEIAEKYELSETRVKTVIRTFKRTIEQHAEN